jgi:pyrrolysine biosynthesis protein PylD
VTRLTPDMIKDVPWRCTELDASLQRSTGWTVKELACEAVGVREGDLPWEDLVTAAVPITSGKGVTAGFSESVCAIVEHLGMRSFQTSRADVAGLSDALAMKADIIFMADDEEFIALNTRSSMFADNTRSTALGYFTAFKKTAGALQGREVLLIGAGRVGSVVLDMLAIEKAAVTVLDLDDAKLDIVRRRHPQFVIGRDLRSEIEEHRLIINCSPARITGEWLQRGAIISSPGMPFSFDEEGIRRAKVLIHDPLAIGVSVMAAWAARMMLASPPLPEPGTSWLEALP